MTSTKAIIQTDDYGPIPHGDWVRFRKLNVSPMDHDEVAEHFGRREFGKIRLFIEDHSTSGYYRAPWPFPNR